MSATLREIADAVDHATTLDVRVDDGYVRRPKMAYDVIVGITGSVIDRAEPWYRFDATELRDAIRRNRGRLPAGDVDEWLSFDGDGRWLELRVS